MGAVIGDRNAICDRCGFKKKASRLRKTWDGLYVCADTCWEPRHPQDYVRGIPGEKPPPWTRPEAADYFLQSGEVTVEDF